MTAPGGSGPEAAFDDGATRAVLYRAPGGAGRVAFSFSANQVNLFGVDFLLREGWDVVALSHHARTWPRTAPAGLGAALRAVAGGRESVTYGSSQGGMVAILWARALGADRAVAISPRASRSVTGGARRGGRWLLRNRHVDWRYAATRDEVAAPLRVAMVYDDRQGVDASIAAQIARAVGDPRRLRRVPVPFSGHPSGQYLKETGQLTALARALLSDAPDLPPVRTDPEVARTSPAWLLARAEHAAERWRTGAARDWIARAEASAPPETIVRQRIVRLRLKVGPPGAAVGAAEALLALGPNRSRSNLLHAQALLRADRPEAALAALERVAGDAHAAARAQLAAQARARLPEGARAGR